MHNERIISRNIDTDCNMGPGKHVLVAGIVHTQSISHGSSKLFYWQHID